MECIHALVLGVLQGVFEWLPISSEGQTMLAMMGFFQLSAQTAFSVAIFLHLGTCLAVLVKFRSEFISILKNLNSKLSRILVVATCATTITAIPLFLLIKHSFTGSNSDAAALLIGVLLILTGIGFKVSKRNGAKDIEDITFRDMITVGLVQGFAILPGVSRSGTTITVLLLSGVKHEVSLFLSFLMSVPVVLGSVFLDLPSIMSTSASASSLSAHISLQAAVIMILSSMVIGYLTMDMLLRVARKVNFSMFCVLLGAITIILVAAPKTFL
jgi:undecaprenyl-diphosphatase